MAFFALKKRSENTSAPTQQPRLLRSVRRRERSLALRTAVPHGGQTTNRIVVSRPDLAGHAGSKCPRDVRTVAMQKGFAPYDLTPFTRMGVRQRLVSVMRSALQVVVGLPMLAHADVLLVLHPVGRLNGWLLSWAASRTRSILFVIDLESLRMTRYAHAERRTLAGFGVVVVHSAHMADHVRKSLAHNEKPTVELRCFDYLATSAIELGENATLPKALYCIGNLSATKASYVYRLVRPALPVLLYGPNCDVALLPAGVEWLGVLDLDHARPFERDGFGLVWDGDSPDDITGQAGHYLHYNLPHKFSLYMALGLPVVVPSDSPLAKLVEREGLGFAVDSVAEGAKKALGCSAPQWISYTEAVEQFRESVITGSNVGEALDQALARTGRHSHDGAV